jgi:large subunit ribosomal protein L15
MIRDNPMKLNELSDNPGAIKTRKRVGRGIGSGKGKTAGRGGKGQTARSGVAINGFEGGQMPMYRRLPKRGFTNPFKVTAQVVNLRQLAKVNGQVVNPETLFAAGLIGKRDAPVKLLGTGDAGRAYTVQGVSLSASARTKLEAAGGTIEA